MNKSSDSSSKLEMASNIKDVCRSGDFSQPTFYKWRAKFGDMKSSDAYRLRGLESENTKLKKLPIEAHLPVNCRSRQWF